MQNERPTLFHAFYRKLLWFYPKPFRERFGESMEQTFDDMSREEKGRPARMFSLTLRISVDTGIGIVKENIFHLSRSSVMVGVLKNRTVAAIIGLLLFLPGALLFSLMILGIEPPLGPLQTYLRPVEGPHILGSLTALAVMLLLPAIGVVINVAAIEGNWSKQTLSHLAPAAIIGSILILPLVILELVYGQASYSNFPVPLFAILWLLPVMFVLMIAPAVRGVWGGSAILANPTVLLFRLAFAVLIAVFWAGLVIDQMPCFLGVPNCD